MAGKDVESDSTAKAPVEQQIGWAIVEQLRKLVAATNECVAAVRENSTMLFELFTLLGVPCEDLTPIDPKPAPKKRSKKAKKEQHEG